MSEQAKTIVKRQVYHRVDAVLSPCCRASSTQSSSTDKYTPYCYYACSKCEKSFKKYKQPVD